MHGQPDKRVSPLRQLSGSGRLPLIAELRAYYLKVLLSTVRDIRVIYVSVMHSSIGEKRERERERTNVLARFVFMMGQTITRYFFARPSERIKILFSRQQERELLYFG